MYVYIYLIYIYTYTFIPTTSRYIVSRLVFGLTILTLHTHMGESWKTKSIMVLLHNTLNILKDSHNLSLSPLKLSSLSLFFTKEKGLKITPRTHSSLWCLWVYTRARKKEFFFWRRSWYTNKVGTLGVNQIEELYLGSKSLTTKVVNFPSCLYL